MKSTGSRPRAKQQLQIEKSGAILLPVAPQHRARKDTELIYKNAGPAADVRSSTRGTEAHSVIETIDVERCTGCGICDEVCPADVIHMREEVVPSDVPGFSVSRLRPVIAFRAHCITCFNCELLCPEHIIDVHPNVKNRPRPW
jgi:Pyruvate/2-oxoacid:ferredoxin oxidoreductase delta subunit